MGTVAEQAVLCPEFSRPHWTASQIARIWAAGAGTYLTNHNEPRAALRLVLELPRFDRQG